MQTIPGTLFVCFRLNVSPAHPENTLKLAQLRAVQIIANLEGKGRVSANNARGRLCKGLYLKGESSQASFSVLCSIYPQNLKHNLSPGFRTRWFTDACWMEVGRQTEEARCSLLNCPHPGALAKISPASLLPIKLFCL